MSTRFDDRPTRSALHPLLAILAMTCALARTSTAQFDFERLNTDAASSGTYGPPCLVGDVNGDRAPDLVIMSFDQLSIRLHVNQGDGTFGPSTVIVAVAPPLRFASTLGLKDVDADGDLDLLYVFGDYSAWGNLGTIVVAKNDGAGVFTTSASFTSPAMWPLGLLVDDFDHDSDVDFAVTHYGHTTAFYLMRNDGTGTFTSSPSTVTGGSLGPYYQIVDLDTDGDPDLFTDNGDGLQTFLLNGGTGTFTVASVGWTPLGSLMGSKFHDLDGDGDLDALGLYNLDHLAIRENQGGLTFGPWTPIPGAEMVNFTKYAVGDFDADGRPDLIIDLPNVPPGNPRIFRNLGGLVFAQTPGVNISGWVWIREAADFDRDGDVDVLTQDGQTGQSTILRNARLAGESFCAGDGSSGACPCANPSPLGAHAGCLNSLGTGATLCGAGAARLSNDTLMLTGAQMPDSPVMYFQGTASVPGIPFGDGLRCANGALTRLGVRFNLAGTSTLGGASQPTISSLGGVTASGLRTYQIYYRDSLSFCTGAGFNLTNAVSILWVP